MKEAKELMLKYTEMLKANTEYVSVGQVVNDLYHLIQDLRIKRIPKHLR